MKIETKKNLTIDGNKIPKYSVGRIIATTTTNNEDFYIIEFSAEICKIAVSINKRDLNILK